MDDRKPSVKCACGHAFEIAPDQLFKDVACPKCGKVVLASPPASGTPKPESLKPAAPKSETFKAVRSEASTATPGAKNDSTKGG